MFRVDKELKGMMAKLKAKHYNASSLIREILKREIGKKLKEVC